MSRVRDSGASTSGGGPALDKPRRGGKTLDRLPGKYKRKIYAEKCDSVYQHVFDSYWDDGQLGVRLGRVKGEMTLTP